MQKSKEEKQYDREKDFKKWWILYLLWPVSFPFIMAILIIIGIVIGFMKFGQLLFNVADTIIGKTLKI